MPGFGIIVSILGLGLLIFIHELGHFLCGKALGLKITEFFLGLPFGKSLVGFTRGETVYGIKPFLFGGYVKFPEFLNLDGGEVDRVAAGSPAQAAGLRKGDRLTAFAGYPFKNWLHFFDVIKERPNQSIEMTVVRGEVEESFSVELGERKGVGWLGIGPSASDDITIEDLPITLEGQGLWKKALVVAAGPTMNVLLAVVLVCGAMMVGFPEPSTTVGKIFPGGPASQAGIKAGDTVTSINGRKVNDWSNVRLTVGRNAGKRVTVVVQRQGKTLVFSPLLRRKSKEGLLGITTKMIRRPHGPIESLKDGFVFIYQAGGLILQFMAKLVTAPKTVVHQLRSPIGVVSETAPIAQRDFMQYIFTLAGISVAIGIFNFLPIPPLDGGRIFISGLEFIIRRPMPKESLAFINIAGLSLLLVLMTYVIGADIFRLAVPGGG